MDPLRGTFIFVRSGMITLALLLGCWILIPLALAEPCGACGGSGFEVEADFLWRCQKCLGTGSPESLTLVLRSRADRILRAANATATCVWTGAVLFVLGALLVGSRSAPCADCRGERLILVEVERPGRRKFRMKIPCAACCGKGGLTRIDRWVARD
jgi:hypothetical protein